MNMQVQVNVSIQKSGYDLIQQLAALIKAMKASGSFSPMQIPADVAIVMATLPAIISDLASVPGDLNQDKIAFIKGVNLGVYDLLAALM